jgi:chlorite dismutase
MHNRFAFAGAESGAWQVTGLTPISGPSLPAIKTLDVIKPGDPRPALQPDWTLHGVTSSVRYATRSELTALRAVQEPLGRAAARCAALIPIKKSQSWWDLAQDERRAIFEEQSRHNAIGLEYLPAVARQLFHSRDIGEPFDFLTWFEFAPEHAPAFDDLLRRLRAAREWTYVEREVEIRLQRA